MVAKLPRFSPFVPVLSTVSVLQAKKKTPKNHIHFSVHVASLSLALLRPLLIFISILRPSTSDPSPGCSSLSLLIKILLIPSSLSASIDRDWQKKHYRPTDPRPCAGRDLQFLNHDRLFNSQLEPPMRWQSTAPTTACPVLQCFMAVTAKRIYRP
ncbi:hypothetical protein M430DRAFT_262643 [Amorphotheca resinae ATCC 22711]|uniref:Uncharacterized protein n=1 Tax=Amorphotheca resinae ATCC 22711 TaxID=857342 RepID=A0A2T3AW81_AMORE|nr:hypothetical protein M430DRAFT_262643 [Amorphotheca resinae ATCC 22711]PSS12928.1 hypothetical protein M430DRAFT_262643 [Amorphotheca resinae ATCC 22711]